MHMRGENRAHAVVLGGSMMGLGAARVLRDRFERVTIIERDALPEAPATRKGVPQGGHGHGLLPSGYRILDACFPGMMDELVADGAIRGDLTGDFLWYQYEGWKLRTDSGLGGIVVSRPCLEAKVRKRVRALPGVTLLDNHDVVEPVHDADSGRVVGVRIEDRATRGARTLDADLVVDATGRGSKSPTWLASWGYGEIPERTVRIDVGYATAELERRPNDLYGAMGAIIAGTSPASTRFAAVLGAEGMRWIVTLVGTLRDYPPTDYEGWRAFAQGLPTRDVLELSEGRQPLGPLLSYRFPANRQLHYEKLTRFPGGYLVAGDAVCSFNPIYGQGMSVALTEAQTLDECLDAGDAGLPARFFAKVAAIADGPWAIATGEDYRYPQVEGARPPGHGLITRYMARAHHATTKDPVVLRRFFDVASLLAPPTAMMSPAIAWRVALGGVGTAQQSPASKAQ